MRISKPFELLEALKPYLKPKDIAQISKYRQTLKNKTMRFTKPLVVQTAYFTVFKRDGMVFFRKDIYGYDKMIQESVINENKDSYSNSIYIDNSSDNINSENEEFSVY